MITTEEFDAWRDEPVTQGILATLADMASAQRDGWLAASWDGGNADPLLLVELRTRADAYAVLAQANYDDFFGVVE